MIQILDNDTINQIAAGEVIERPSAVVKELVENAIDAGSTAITIEIKEGGISFIRITDNGSGIAKNEIKTAFMRHATSKIRTMEDLLTASSLGFRGEALSSIAAVAQVELITRSRQEITGVRYEIAGGEEKSMEEVGCPEGTTFVVRNLFYNTPARKKFLKTKTTEGGYIQDLVLRYSLAHSDIRFHFIADGKTRLQTSGDGQVKTNIFYNYGPDVTRCIVPVEAESGEMKLTGFIGRPELSRGNRTFMNYFVNGRYIKSLVITGAIEQAYREFLMNHRYPFTVLMLSIDSRCLDVNVHPTKLEVRFTNQEEVYNFFYQSIYDTLKQSTQIPEVTLEPETKRREPAAPMPRAKQEEKSPEPFEKKAMERMDKEPGYAEMLPEEKPPLCVKEGVQMNLIREELIREDVPQFRIIGQVFDTYWLLEYQSELLIIDQHAAHEKVLYERLMKRLEQKEGLTQNLAAPVVVTLSAREMETLSANAEVFENIGFRFESFGDREYLIQGVPSDFLDVPGKELFLELLDGLMEEGNKKPETVLERCASMACKAAVKGNTQMSLAEARKLFEQMLCMDQPYHCPHGRPTTIAMSKREFEKKFKRIV